MKLRKMLLAVVGATVLLAAMVGTASARQFRLSSTAATATFPRVEFRGGLATTRCNVTLGARFHSTTLTKQLETLVGYITSAAVGGCEVGSATVLTNTLPWHIRYAGFSGTLPSISRISTKVVGSQFRISEGLFGIECLATSTAESATTGTYNREAGGRITSAEIGGSIPCNPGGITGSLRGTSNSVTAITVTLI